MKLWTLFLIKLVCGSPSKFFKCGKSHHAMLHYHQPKSSSDEKQHSGNYGSSRDSSDKYASVSRSGKGTTDTGQTACGVATGAATIVAASGALIVSFMAVPVTLIGARGPIRAMAFLNSGSSCSFMTESLLDQLGLPAENGSLETTVLGGQKMSNINRHSSVEITHTNGGSSHLTAWILPQIMDPL